jgi:hypothetical protein
MSVAPGALRREFVPEAEYEEWTARVRGQGGGDVDVWASLLVT